MIVRTVEDVAGTEQEVILDDWSSRRLLVKRDGVGFSLHDSVIRAGSEITMCYKHHVEAVYCVEGEAEVELLPNGPTYTIRPGTLYALDGHEHHVLRARTTFRAICVFNPAVTGSEVHGEDGAFPLPSDAT